MVSADAGDFVLRQHVVWMMETLLAASELLKATSADLERRRTLSRLQFMAVWGAERGRRTEQTPGLTFHTRFRPRLLTFGCVLPSRDTGNFATFADVAVIKTKSGYAREACKLTSTFLTPDIKTKTTPEYKSAFVNAGNT